MPPIKRVAGGVNRPGIITSVASRIIPVSQVDNLIKISIYGEAGSGKTHIASTFPKPLLIVGIENGIRTIKNVPNTFMYPVRTVKELDELIREKSIITKYKTVVLDNATELELLHLKEILKMEELPAQLSWGLAEQSQWQQVSLRLKTQIKMLLKYANDTVILSHERVNAQTKKSKQDPDNIFPNIGPALTPSSAGWLNGQLDYTIRAFKRNKVEVEMVKTGRPPNVTVERVETVTDEVEYAAMIGPNTTYFTKMRVPVGQVLPESLVNPNYAKIKAIIDGKNPTLGKVAGLGRPKIG